ncbi:MAG: amylo-alpha-1,6-glucosidase [Actinomycetota bacterium]
MNADADPDPARGSYSPAPGVKDPAGRVLKEGVPVVLTDLPTRVLATKEGDAFVYADVEGNLDDRHEYGFGFYFRDTRFLSHYRLRISGRDPLPLSSSAERGYLSAVDLSNPALYEDDRLVAPQQSLNIRRVRVVSGGMHERIKIRNYNPFPVGITIDLSFGADFADIFEVRGLARETRGTFDPPVTEERRIEFGYLGEDGLRRLTRIEFGVSPEHVDVRGDLVSVSFAVHLGARDSTSLSLFVEPIVENVPPEPHQDFDAAVHGLRRSYQDWEAECTQVRTDNELFNQWIERGVRDLRALYTRIDGDGIIAAGIPWFVAPFGRDTLITSHQMLMLNERPARESLRTLARLQGTKTDDWREEDPGKIPHEIRYGELASAGYLPHTPYFGSVDSTPWFLILLAQYHRWTADDELIRELLPAAEAALAWIDEYGDLDGDGFVEYQRRSPRGLANQGWKDAWDSVVHTDGRLAEPPIALVEIQGYVYMAKMRMADVYESLGDHERAAGLRKAAGLLRERFNEAFWMEDEGTYCEALDGEKQQVRTVVSNPGHCLYCDIVEPDRAERLVRRLFQPDMFSGWGIRTLSKSSVAYNPMSYHNGSVWPHDNALIAAGLKRYGFVTNTNVVATVIFDAAIHTEYMRLPELYCGFTRRSPNRPVQYPVACSPQGWAAGSPFLLLQAMLGISARAPEGLLTVNKPHLPPWLNHVELRGMRVGNGSISLEFRREGEITSFSLIEREGDVRVIMEE